jgi:Ca2+-transporting ATPase
MEKEHIISYHSLPLEEVFQKLGTSAEGLRTGDVNQKIQQFGKNTIVSPQVFNYFLVILGSLKNPFSLILFSASLLSFVSGHSIDGFVILAVLCINTGIEIYHQKSAHTNIELLKKDVMQTSTVLRDGFPRKIPAEDIVPGDIVFLEEGDLVPADGRIIELSHLSINESSLTGESTPVQKNTSRILGVVPSIDLYNMAWMGSTVSEGSGTMVVTNTGFRTQFGSLYQQLQKTTRGSNPFLERIKKLSRTIGIGGVVITLIIFLIRFGILDNNLGEIIIFSLAVLVSIIPESLPTVINITLARGAKYLAEDNAVVKELSTIESIGGTTVIITDKTGTLTENSMRVEYGMVRDNTEFEVTGFGWKSVGMFMKDGHRYNPKDNTYLDTLLDYALLSNRAHVYEEDGRNTVIGEPTEAALLVMAEKDGRERGLLLKDYNIISRTRFLHTKKILVTVVEKEGKMILIAVGAPESIWSMSDADTHAQEKTEEKAHLGLRTIAFAYKVITKVPTHFETVTDMTYLGFVAMRDPVRKGVKEMIEQAKEAGIRIIMATGDHRKTATSIGRELGIIKDDETEVIEGSAFLLLDEKEQKERLKTVAIFARVTPDIKLQITKILQKNKEVVTMIGDGVNDVLALRQADVGVAMGNSGTDAARSASSIVLTDDNFSTIIRAIFRGRHVFHNIRQVTSFLLSTNAAEALVLIMVTFLGLPLPLIATQILLINLVTDGVGSLPFAFKKPSTSIIPRPHKGVLLSRFDYGIIGSATLGMAVATLIGFALFLEESLVYSQSMAFLVLSLTQLGRLISIDTYHTSLLRFKISPWLVRSVGISFSIILLVFALPVLRETFNLAILRLSDVGLAFLLSLLPLVSVELYKSLTKTFTKKIYA